MSDGGYTSGFVGGFINPQDPQGQSGQTGQTQPVPPVPPAPQPQPVQPAQAAPVYGMPQGTFDPNAGYQAPSPAPQAPQAPVGYDPYAMPPAPPAFGGPSAGMAPAGAPIPGMGDQSQPGFDPNYKFGDRMKNFTTTVKLPEHTVKVDEAVFLNLLAGSISLTKDEKKKIVDSFGKLRQEQVDELIRIFEEERAKFIELSPKHGPQLKKLEDEHAADWKDIEIAYTAATKKDEEDAKADAIRKQLGLN